MPAGMSRRQCRSWRAGGSSASVVRLVLVADEVQRAGGAAVEGAPADQRFLAAVGDPGLARVELGDGGGELGPVAVVGDDERQLDAALAGAGADLHPAGGEGDQRVGEAADPGALEGRGRAEDDLAGEVAGAAAGEGGVGEVAEGDAAGGVVVAEAAERAVEVDRGVVAGGAEEARSAAAPCRGRRRRRGGCARGTGRASGGAWRSRARAAGWRKTGRAKVASVMKMSQGTGSKGAQVGSGVRL